MTEIKRVFVGGLSSDITQDEIKERFQRFCEVLHVEIKKKRKLEDIPEKVFAYLNVKSTPENLKKCFALYNKTKWKGSELKLQLAKDDFLTRLEDERKNGFAVTCTKTLKKNDIVEYHNPFENLPDPSSQEMRACVPGTKVPGEKNWVVGKYGRVLPVVFIRNKDKKKIVKVDPSKFCHNVKRIKDNENILSEPGDLTLQVNDDDSEMTRKRKGEFPHWKPTQCKQKKIDFERLKEMYLSADSNPVLTNLNSKPDFEIVSTSDDIPPLRKTYESDDSDSDSYYTTLKQSSSRQCLKVTDSVGLSSGQHSQITESAGMSDVDKSDDSESDSDLIQHNFNAKNDRSQRLPQEEIVSVKKTKPKLQPFRGTKICQLSEEISNTGAHQSINIQDKNHSVEETKNDDMVHHFESFEDKVTEGFSIQNVTENVCKAEKTVVMETDSEDDGNISDVSADTDEIINRSKTLSPEKITKTSDSKCYTKDSTKKQVWYGLSAGNEYSSGLVKGELPIDDESCGSYSEVDESDDESDFEKYALKETEKAKKIRNNFPGSPLSETTKQNEHRIEQHSLQPQTEKQLKRDINIKDTETVRLLKDKKETVESVSFSGTTNKSSLLVENNDGKNTQFLSDNGKGIERIKKDNRKKETDLDSNKRRLESLKQRKQENLAQKSAIQKALTNIDSGVTSNKKIIFDSEDEDSDVPSKETETVTQDSDSTTDDSDTSEVEDDRTIQKNIPGLFDSSDSESSETDMFKIRPEFEGKAGQKRMELQSRYGNDDRFKLDERFIESEEEDNVEDTMEPVEEDEKKKALRILEDVVGTKIITEKKKKMFRDISALHFDPNKEDHIQYEVKDTKTIKEKKNRKKHITEKEKEKESVDEIPEVGKEKFFEVSDSLKNAFKQGTSSSEEAKGFSLLTAFGSQESNDIVEDIETGENEPKEVLQLQTNSNMFPWQHQFQNDSSDDSESDVEEKKEKRESFVFNAGTTFFFRENDSRISEGVKNFCRHDTLDIIREKWLTKKPDLVEAYRTKHRRLLRKTKMEEKNKKKTFIMKTK